MVIKVDGKDVTEFSSVAERGTILEAMIAAVHSAGFKGIPLDSDGNTIYHDVEITGSV